MDDAHRTEGLTPARLRAVLAVAASGSFSVAAREIGSSQSNVSRSVAAVEKILGAPIFERSTRVVRVTEVGREFVERASIVTAELDAALRSARPDTAPAPRLTIASLASVSELHLATAIARLGDSVRRFRCVEGLQALVAESVMSGQATIGIGDLAQVPDELDARPLWTEPFRLAVGRDHRLARRRRVDLDELADEPLVGFSRDAELRTTLDRELAAARQLRAPDLIVDRYRTALSLVAAGRGVMVVPAIVAAAVPSGAKLVDLDHRELRRTMGTIRLRDSAVPDTLARVVGHIVDRVLESPGVEAIDMTSIDVDGG